MASAELPHATDDDILNRLRETVQLAVSKTGAKSKTVEDIMLRLTNLKFKFETLSSSEKSEFIQKMQNSFEDTISSIEDKLSKQERSNQLLIFSIIGLVVVLLVFALFGYKLYKSLMEKKLKKQEKQKNTKKSKKTKQK